MAWYQETMEALPPITQELWEKIMLPPQHENVVLTSSRIQKLRTLTTGTAETYFRWAFGSTEDTSNGVQTGGDSRSDTG